ncbi:MAG: hypothetical protein ACOYOP_03935 [Microthrixaceae bacterium]
MAEIPTSELLDDLAGALATLDVPIRVDGDSLVVDGTRCSPTLVARAHPTPADLGQLVHDHRGHLPAVVLADRISDAGRAVLRDAGWGWYDRRGHLRLWARGIRIEAPLPGDGRSSSARRRPSNLWTPLGLEVALSALVDPTEPVTARRVARKIGRSVGATHELLVRFGEEGLIGRTSHRPLLPDLFWETAAHWPDGGWIALAEPLEEVGRTAGAEHVVRVDERAATLGGARIAAAGDLTARAYVTSDGALRRARRLADPDRPTRSWVRSSPVQWLPDHPDHPSDEEHPWRVAAPMVCALRLAADPSRGREIVEAWGIVPKEGGA